MTEPAKVSAVDVVAEVLCPFEDHTRCSLPRCDADRLASQVLAALRTAISEGRLDPAEVGLEPKVWHAVMDFQPHPECNEGCETVYRVRRES